jgi:hypothetical protein
MFWKLWWRAAFICVIGTLMLTDPIHAWLRVYPQFFLGVFLGSTLELVIIEYTKHRGD